MFCSVVLIRKYFVLHRGKKVFLAVAGGRTVHILLELSVKTGQAAVARLLRNDIDRLPVQIDQMAGLPATVVLDVL